MKLTTEQKEALHNIATLVAGIGTMLLAFAMIWLLLWGYQ